MTATKSAWRWAAGLVIALVTRGLAAGWETYPRFLDSYYHLAVIQGFQQAGGVTLHAFWESAPAGRAHLYPPLFHLLWWPVAAVVRDPITVARLWSVAGGPLLLLMIVWAVRRVAGTRAAALTVLAALLSSHLLFSTLIHPTATLALLEIVGVWMALERRQALVAGILAGLIGWTHPGLPWIVLPALLLLGAMDRARRHAWAAAGIGLLVMAPWWLHIARHAAALRAIHQPEGRSLEFAPVLLGLGLWGATIAWRRAPAYRFWLALVAAALPWAALYPYRLFSGQGLLPIILLAGLALDEGVRPLLVKRGLTPFGSKVPGQRVSRLSLFGASLILLVAGPVVMNHPRWHVRWGETGVTAALGGIPLDRGHLESLYDARQFAPLVAALRREARPNDLLFCYYPHMGGLFSVLTGLSTTTSMFAEAGRRPWQEALADAQWVLWFKMPAQVDSENDATAQRLAGERGWRVMEETPIAWVFEQPSATARRRIR
ncbi:MAG: hypothetical protein HY600_07400 [Candidatus Omnitrophica bacterium]|nr:hypothetical protein [Candidatus Omnitrophota bacterium]